MTQDNLITKQSNFSIILPLLALHENLPLLLCIIVLQIKDNAGGKFENGEKFINFFFYKIIFR